jgi:hypothetical protein
MPTKIRKERYDHALIAGGKARRSSARPQVRHRSPDSSVVKLPAQVWLYILSYIGTRFKSWLG